MLSQDYFSDDSHESLSTELPSQSVQLIENVSNISDE